MLQIDTAFHQVDCFNQPEALVKIPDGQLTRFRH